MNFSNLAVLANAAELSLAEKGVASAKVVLTGFVVVFAVLVLLIFIIKIYGSIVTKALQPNNKKKNKVVEKQKTAIAPAKLEKISSAPDVQDGVSEEVVAVISAAVATMYVSPEKARIKSIKKSGSGRSAWANAGLLNNTRPF